MISLSPSESPSPDRHSKHTKSNQSIQLQLQFYCFCPSGQSSNNILCGLSLCKANTQAKHYLQSFRNPLSCALLAQVCAHISWSNLSLQRGLTLSQGGPAYLSCIAAVVSYPLNPCPLWIPTQNFFLLNSCTLRNQALHTSPPTPGTFGFSRTLPERREFVFFGQ